MGHKGQMRLLSNHSEGKGLLQTLFNARNQAKINLSERLSGAHIVGFATPPYE